MNPSLYVSLEVAQELVEAGIVFDGNNLLKSSTVFIKREKPNTNTWTEYELIYFKDIMQWTWDGINLEDYKGGLPTKHIPAPSLSEIMEELPDGYAIKKIDRASLSHNEYMCFEHHEARRNYEIELTAPDAAAKMLIRLRSDSKDLPRIP